MSNFATVVRRSVETHPKQPALVAEGEEYTYADLWVQAGAFAGGLREYGVKSGDVVAICLPNVPEFVVSLLGTIRNGSIAVPISPRHSSETLATIFEDCSVDIAVVLDDQVMSLLSNVKELEAIVRLGDVRFGVEFAEFIDTDGLYDYWEIIDRDDDDTALVSYAGRSTEPTTGVSLSHEGLRSNVETIATLVPDGLSADDVQLGIMPAFHLLTIAPIILATLARGSVYSPLQSPSVSATVGVLESGEITVLHAAPTMLTELVSTDAFAAADLSSLRAVGSIGDPLPPDVRTRFREAGCENCYQLVGQTETGPISLAATDDVEGHCLGKPVPGADAQIINDGFTVQSAAPATATAIPADHHGELVVSSPSIATGYYNEPSLTDQSFTVTGDDRWFHTGITAYRDTDGYVYRVE